MRTAKIMAALILPSVLISACAGSTTMQLAQDTVQITASAAPICGAEGAQRAAMRRAAVETIRHGFDRFVIFGGNSQATIQSVTYFGQPGFGTATANYSHDQAITVKMYHTGDAGAGNALDAKTILGPKWQSALSSPQMTCLDD